MGTGGYLIYAMSGAGAGAAAMAALTSLVTGSGAGALEYAFRAVHTGSWDNSEFGMYVSGEALNWYSVDGMLRGISGAVKIVRNSSGVRSFLYDEAGSVSYEGGSGIGGSNSFSNAQVLSRSENIIKSNK